MQEIKRYTFNFFTGYGIREISPHTIRIYPISIKSFSFEDAVIKMKKKALSASKYNDWFNTAVAIQVLEEYNKKSKVGLYWIEDTVVKCEWEICYDKPLVFGKAWVQSFELPKIESHYGNWVADYCCGRIIYSYVGWIKYSLDRFDYDRFYSTASVEKQKSDYKKYVVDEIQYLIASDHCPEEDKEILKTIKLCKNN